MTRNINFPVAVCIAFALITHRGLSQDAGRYFAITVVDKETRRGVPLVELKTTGGRRFYTDSQGRIAFYEPALMNQKTAFSFFSHGYECPPDLLGQSGFFLTPTPGGSSLLNITRVNIAERLYRITGQDIYGESAKLGLPVPIRHQNLNGKVMGQDTFIETLYKGKLYWFWGDTIGPAEFNGKASGATSELPGKGGLDPGVGVELDYFVDSSGFCKPICPFGGPTLVWIQWLATLKDNNGEHLYAFYRCINRDGKPGEAGFAVFNDSAQAFEQVKIINEWYGQDHRSGHPVLVNAGGHSYFYIINYDGLERVEADYRHLTDPSQYEHFTCYATGAKYDTARTNLDRTREGDIIYGWKSNTDALNHRRQDELIRAGRITAREGLWQLRDIEGGTPVPVDPSSVFWNNFRKRWIMIAYEFTGGVWFFEGDTPTGPWAYGRKIVSHEHYDFYNVGQHPLFDQEKGRLIYFEGTYTTGFSGNTCETPLYNYNQIMYRLALDDTLLALPAPVYHLKSRRDEEEYQMREGVDSSDLWESIDKIPFYAIPPERKNDDFIPVFSKATENGTVLETKSRAHIKPIFYALPAEVPPDPVSGTWLCKPTPEDDSQSNVRVVLRKNGGQIEGPCVKQGTYKDGQLDLVLQVADYILTGTLKDGNLTGDYRKLDGKESGKWVGERINKTHDANYASSSVPLYEYRDSAGRYLYSVDSTLTDRAMKRTPQPLCRVWPNPSSVIALDYKTRPARLLP